MSLHVAVSGWLLGPPSGANRRLLALLRALGPLLAPDERITALHRADFAPPLRLPLFLERGWVLATGRGKTATFALADDCMGRPDRAYPEIVAALQRDGWTSPEGPPAPLLTPRRR